MSAFTFQPHVREYRKSQRGAFLKAARWYDRNAAATINTKHYPKEYWPVVEKSGITVSRPSPEELEDFRQQALLTWDMWKKRVGEEVGARAIRLAMGTDRD